MNIWTHAKNLARNTPDSRNRYVDCLRLISIAVVVLGHWLMAVLYVGEGGLETDHLLAAAPASRYVTWILQVMPLFFIVGGYANFVSWQSARASGRTYGMWLRSRTERLLRPTVVFAVGWLGIAAVLLASPVDRDLLRAGAQIVAVPLWFLAVYLMIVALAPVMVVLDRRWGWAVPVVLTLVAGGVDVLHRGASISFVGWVNYLFVWAAIHQLGVRWAAGVLSRRLATAALLASAGLASIVGLTTSGLYPVSMVGVPGATMTNTGPPTVALIALAIWQLGLILMLRRPAERLLSRSRVWAGVIVGNARIMTIYLWHMTAMVLVAGVLALGGGIGLRVSPLSATWWWTRPVWFTVLALPLLGFLALFGRFETTRRTHSSGRLPLAASVLGVVMTGLGFALLALRGFAPAPETASPAVTPVLAVVAGAYLLGVRYRRPAHERR